MTPAELLAHFDRLADAPDAVPRLRRFVLDLAVRGKLVPQETADEPAAKLLRRITDERSSLGKGNPGARESEVAEIKAEDAPFARPMGWEWVRLGHCLRMVNGRAFKPSDWKPAGLPIVRIQNLNSESAPFNYCDPRDVDDRHIIDNGSFLISWSGTPGTSFGAFIWQRGKAALNQHIFHCFQIGPAFTDHFLRLAINGRLDEMISKAHGGVGLQHITKGKLENLVLSLPPLAEQQRIVARVDELMALCDKLEAAQAEREGRRDRLMRASLGRLNQPADDAATFRDHARFALDHLPRLATRPEHVPQLRQAILNLAVRGKLVPQDPKGGPAAELLKRIATEKADRLKRGELKQQQAIERVDNDPPFPTPESWCWAQMDDCFAVSGGMQKTPARTPKGNAFPYLGVGNVYRGRLDLAEVKRFELQNGELERYRLIPGDVLVVEGNGSASEIGRCARWSGEIKDCVHQNHIIRCRPFVLGTVPYIMTFLNSPIGIEVMKSLAVTSSGLYSLSVGKIRAITIPLPPLAEQNRIVAKVEELMAVCDRLENQLTSARDGRGRLLEAVIDRALQPAGG